jgi:membrane-bound lytic murein transglycosylase A
MAAMTAVPIDAHAEGATRTILRFTDLHGWAADDHAAALRVFTVTCRQLPAGAWTELCAAASRARNARTFFETNFVPVLIRDDRKPLFTGYYEPELAASRNRIGPYQYPIYRVPDDLPRGAPWLTRREIEEDQALSGRGLEIAWLADPVDAFFLHVQGSGRLRLPDGSAMRVGFAGKNGRRYRSIGREMARLGLLPETRVSARAIRDWVHAHPDRGREIMWHNPSYIFFQELNLPPDAGPIGAMARPVTPMRSVAVDPDFTPLGAPVWIEKGGRKPLDRLMVAQDTGSAIKGAQRADIFYGSGKAAGEAAGRIRDGGRMVVLFPRTLVPGG